MGGVVREVAEGGKVVGRVGGKGDEEDGVEVRGNGEG